MSEKSAQVLLTLTIQKVVNDSEIDNIVNELDAQGWNVNIESDDYDASDEPEEGSLAADDPEEN